MKRHEINLLYRIGCLIVACICCIHLTAKVEVKAHFLTTADGLSNNSVRYLYQDSKGFIWMGTMNGLNRYDGNSFITFRSQNDGQMSLADNRVWSIREDKHGFLWIGTVASLFSCYDLKHDCFVDYTGCGQFMDQYRYITFIDDDVWLYGDDGCRHISYQYGKFVSESFGGKRNNHGFERVRLVKKGTEGNIWICTNKGLFSWKDGVLESVDQSKQYQWVTTFEKENYFVSTDGKILRWKTGHKMEVVAQIPRIHTGYDLPGEITLNGEWVLFTSQGGYIFHPETATLRRAPKELDIVNGKVILDNRGDCWVSNGTGKLRYIEMATGCVRSLELMNERQLGFIDMERYHIVHDQRGMIWISTYGNGLFVYHPQSEEISHYDAMVDKEPLTGSNSLMYLMEDRSGSIWVSSEFAGVAHLNVTDEGAVCLSPEDNGAPVRMIADNNSGDIYLGTRDGRLFLYDNLLTRQKKAQTFHSNVYAIAEDTLGVEWIGTRNDGVYVGGRNYRNDKTDSSSLSDNQVFCMMKDSAGRIWIGTLGGGLNLAVPDGKGGYCFKQFLLESYAMKRVRTLCEDSNGWIWVGTSEGLVVFHPEELLEDNQAYHQYSLTNQALKSNEIRSITKDSRGNIWVAETGAGFSVCTLDGDYNNLEFKHYGTENGLVNDMVQAFIEDEQGCMWISTEYGISCFYIENESFENYFFFKDILGNVYSENSAFRLKDGRIVMGTNHGLFIANPAKVRKKHNDLTVIFTDLKVNGVSISTDKSDNSGYVSLPYTDKVQLSYDRNSFVADFSTLDYATASSKYSYLLENYDEKWSPPSSMNFAMYKNLAPGAYRLRVRACDETGLWGMSESILTIVIKPPFWLTGWAFLFYGLLILAAVYVTYRVLEKMNTLRNNVKIEKQLTEYKLVFFTNISHEFRTPLTLIRAALEKIAGVGTIPKEMENSIKIMDKSSQRMLRLVNQLLEFRKMQNDKLALSLEKTDVMVELQEISMNFRDVVESKRMSFNFIPSVLSYTMFVDKGYLDKIVYNLLSNAFKYTPTGGQVEMRADVDTEKNTLTIQVKDTGVGVPKDKQNQLFKRFMQSSFSNSSVGVGLHLTQELVRVHKGTIAFSENPEGGSIFTVTLPTDSSVYEEKDFLDLDNALMKDAEQHTEEDSIKEQTAHGRQSSNPFNGRKILIIEDDTQIREFLKDELAVYFEVLAEADGISGLERARKEEVDLIVCDVMMPGKNGFEVTSELKSDFNTSHVPVILLTALGSTENQVQGAESGADVYMTKPFSTKLLVTKAVKLMEQRDKLREKFSSDLSFKVSTICITEKDKEFVDSLNSIIEEELDNPDFTADDFATRLGMGRSVFFRKMRGIVGYSPKEYLRIVRMKKAAELLSANSLNISEVAYKVGINDPLYFSKCFKQQFGMSPSAYLKQVREQLDAVED